MDTKDIKFASVVLVGLCNGDPLAQALLGQIVFRENGEGQLEPRLVDPTPGEEAGSRKNPFKTTFQWKRKGSYGLCFPDVARGHGVSVTLDKNEGKYYFTTGINHGDSGSSGPLSNGGPELVDVLDVLFGFVPVS